MSSTPQLDTSDPSIGVDDIAIYVPRLRFDMKTFAELRDVDYGKLNRGLGLEAMAIPDLHEDPATMGANAVMRLIDRNELDPRQIGRLYLGTESALDGAKPTATYILDMLTQRYAPHYGRGCFARCDVVDMTFACVGAVDALHNTLDWVARGGVDEDRAGIVVFTDYAKYDIGSSGEYTQGAGAGALLVKHNPRLFTVPDVWGVSTEPAHDFFKPRRHISPERLIHQVLSAAQEAGVGSSEELNDEVISRALSQLSSEGEGAEMWRESQIAIHRDTPLFDGPLSNRCYAQRVKEAFVDFRARALRADAQRDSHSGGSLITEQWRRIILHLPYAYQGKRMFPDIFRYERQDTPMWNDLIAQIGEAPRRGDIELESDYEAARDAHRRAISKTDVYRTFVAEKIERGQRASSLIGNLYTGSIFVSLISTLEADLAEGEELTGAQIGLCGYGSGAKAKVFEIRIQPGWREITARFGLMERLDHRVSITAEQYEQLHRGQLSASLHEPAQEFALTRIGGDGLMEGQREYRFVD